MPRAVRFHDLGGREVLRIEEVTLREPAAGEARLAVAAAGVNRSDSMFYHGLFNESPQLPSGLGYEVVGTVLEVGPGVDPLLVGKQFATVPGYSRNRFPSLGEQAIVAASDLAALPPSLSPIEGAAVWMPYAAAYGALLQTGKVTAGDAVLIRAASSSVGLAAIQIARAEGAIAIAATRTPAKKQQLLELGAHHVVVTDEEDLPARVREITGGHGARLVLDPVAGDYVGTLAQATRSGGIIILYGRLSGQPTPFPQAAWGRGICLTSFAMAEQVKLPGLFEAMKQYVYNHFESGAFKPHIDRVFPFAESVAAYEYLETNQQVGKIVIAIQPDYEPRGRLSTPTPLL